MRQIESHNDRVAREQQAAVLKDVNLKLDAILAHLQVAQPELTKVEPAPEVDESHLQDKEGETGGVPQVRPEQEKVPAKVSDIPNNFQETGPADGGLADGSPVPQVKATEFPDGVNAQTRSAVTGELQARKMEKQRQRKEAE